jgi:hypothetical protein
MTLEAGVVLDAGRHWRIWTECDQSAYTLSSPFSHVITPWTVARLAGPLLALVTGIEEKNFPH